MGGLEVSHAFFFVVNWFNCQLNGSAVLSAQKKGEDRTRKGVREQTRQLPSQEHVKMLL